MYFWGGAGEVKNAICRIHRSFHRSVFCFFTVLFHRLFHRSFCSSGSENPQEFSALLYEVLSRLARSSQMVTLPRLLHGRMAQDGALMCRLGVGVWVVGWLGGKELGPPLFKQTDGPEPP